MTERATGVEVEVDTETGEVAVLSLKSAYEVGRALNPRMVEQQIIGAGFLGEFAPSPGQG